MRIGLAALFSIGLLGSACADWSAGCGVSGLDRPLESEWVGARAVEFYLPAQRVMGMGPELLSALAAQGADRIAIAFPTVSGSVGQLTAWEVEPATALLQVAWLDGQQGEGGLSFGLGLAPAAVGLRLRWETSGGQTEACDLDLGIPEQTSFVRLVLGPDAQGGASLRVDGTPRLSGAPFELVLEADCGLQALDTFGPAVTDALAVALQEAFGAWTASLGAVCEQALGVKLGASGALGEVFSFSLLPDPTSTSLAAGETRLGLAGGFASQRAACVPADLAPLPPTSDLAAAFDDLLPKSQEPYGLAISVSRGYLAQGLAAAQRSGLLCRRAGNGNLLGVDLTGALSSLGALGLVDAVRAGVWPRGPIGLQWGLADTAAGETLPRLLVLMPATRIDLYARMDGADLRVLGLSADITWMIAPGLDGHDLRLRLAGVQVAGLTIEYAELVTEQAGTLRDAARQLVGQVGAAWIDQLGPLSLGLPTSAGPELLEYRLSGDQLLLYF